MILSDSELRPKHGNVPQHRIGNKSAHTLCKVHRLPKRPNTDHNHGSAKEIDERSRQKRSHIPSDRKYESKLRRLLLFRLLYDKSGSSGSQYQSQTSQDYYDPEFRREWANLRQRFSPFDESRLAQCSSEEFEAS